nr:MAG TPA: hypothetical protein [Caudoviricetes sp.]
MIVADCLCFLILNICLIYFCEVFNVRCGV